jgi:hypothetical protein
MAPRIIGLSDPILDIIIPEAGPNNTKVIANGNWMFPVLTASRPKPKGSGFLASIGID